MDGELSFDVLIALRFLHEALEVLGGLGLAKKPVVIHSAFGNGRKSRSRVFEAGGGSRSSRVGLDDWGSQK